MHFLLCMRYTCSLVLIPYPFGLHRSLQYQTGSSFQYSRWILEKQLQSPVKQRLEVEYANGLTPYWNQYGFPRMKSLESMKSVNTRLLFPWYGIRTDILPPYLGLGITFRFNLNTYLHLYSLSYSCCWAMPWCHYVAGINEIWHSWGDFSKPV